MNQLSTNSSRRRIPLILRYLIVCIIAVVFITGSIVGSIELDRRQETEIEINNLYEIAEIQIAAQYNNIVGDALNVEALTVRYLEEDTELTNINKQNLVKMYQNMINNTQKYAAITYITPDGEPIYAGEPKGADLEEFMIQNYQSGADQQILYAYFSHFNHSRRVKEVTFTVTIPMQDSREQFAGYIVLEPYLGVIIKDVERALANANIHYEMLSIEDNDAVYIYSDLETSRGSESLKLSRVKGSDISQQVVYGGELSGSFSSDDGESYYHRFEMPVSNYYGEKHNYISPNNYIYVLTLPTEYFNEITLMDRSTLALLAIAVAVLSLLITILLYVAQSNRRKFAAKTTKMAQVDTLTGLLNRAYFTELFENLVEEDPESKHAILFMDLDGFKDINDSYGHNMGDKVLRVVANRLVMSARREDLVSRFGGDEFAMLISYNSIDQVRYVANKVVKAIDELMVIDGNEYHVGVSVGVAIYPDHARSVDDLYKIADNAMYKVKYSTKNAYHISKGEDKLI